MNSRLIRKSFFGIIYIYAYYNFFAEFISSSLATKESIVFLALDSLFLLLGVITLRSTSDKIYFGLFIILTIFSQLFNQTFDKIQYLNGFRDFIPVFCAPFVIKYLIDKNRAITINSFNIFLKLFLLLQIPVAILQYRLYGPGDDVGGTLGVGFSGQLTILIYLATFYLFKFDNLSFNTNNFKNLAFIFACWIPTFINETKISFILIPIFFILQLKLNRSQIIKSTLFVLIFLPSLFLILRTTYDTNERTNSGQFDQEFIENYIYGDERDTEYDDLPRFLRLELGIKRLSEDTYSLIVGKGLGQFKGGTTLDKTEFALQNEEIMSGSIIYIFFVLMQLGILGLVLILTYIFSHIIINRSYQDNQTTIFFIVMTLLAISYGTTFRGAFYSITFFFILLILKLPKVGIGLENSSIKRNNKSKKIFPSTIDTTSMEK